MVRVLRFAGYVGSLGVGGVGHEAARPLAADKDASLRFLYLPPRSKTVVSLPNLYVVVRIDVNEPTVGIRDIGGAVNGFLDEELLRNRRVRRPELDVLAVYVSLVAPIVNIEAEPGGGPGTQTSRSGEIHRLM